MKRLRFSLVAALLVLGCVPGQPTQPAPAPVTSEASPSPEAPSAITPSLSGIVYDDNDQPLANGRIEVRQDGKVMQTVETDVDGRYQFSLAPGAYSVSASKDGYVSREQAVTVTGATKLNFGGWDQSQINPYFLSTYPEIRAVTVEEEAPGGPMAVTLRMSEPLTAESQKNLISRLELRARDDAAFLRPADGSIPELVAKSEWDEAGQNLTIRYDGPYLASGTTPTPYTLRLRQVEKDTLDPVTRETEWEDLRIVDAEGKELGRNRADYAFVSPRLTAFPASLLADKSYGYSPEIRRWNLTHTSRFSFEAAKDTIGPGLTSVSVDVNEMIGSSASDVLTLRFTEPMRVVKDRDELQYTRLDADKPLLDMFVINVSKDAEGRNPQPLASVYQINRFRFSKTDPNVVYAHFPPNAFKDMQWVQVTLADEARDPADNKPAAGQLQVSGQVTSAEE